MRATALALLCAAGAHAQCPLNMLELKVGTAEVPYTNAMPQPMLTGDCTMDPTPAGGSCTGTLGGYTQTQAAQCTGTTWTSQLVFEGLECGTLAVADGPTITGMRTGEARMVTCDQGFSCGMMCETTCNAMMMGDMPSAVTCTQMCTVPAVVGATVQAPCVAGEFVEDMTQCTYAEQPGYTCMNTMPTCMTPNFDNTPTCQPDQCAAYTFPMGTGIIAGVTDDDFQNGLRGCTDGEQLFQAGAARFTTCKLRCDTADGYKAREGLLRCAPGTGTPAPTTDLTCEEVMCTGTFDFANANVESVALGGCDSVREMPCALTCRERYIESTAGSPSLQCTRDTGDNGKWVLTNPCEGPVTCAGYSCPRGFGLVAGNECTELTRNAGGMIECVSGMVNNGVCCPNRVTCPDFSSGPDCNCNTGYVMRNPVMPTPWENNAWAHSCDPEACDVYTMPTGVVGGVVGSVAACQMGVQLTAVPNSNECGLVCDAGYTGTPQTLRCDPGKMLVTTIACSEKRCAPFTMPAGAEPGTTGTGCDDTMPTVLTPVTNPRCSVRCRQGWSGGSTTVSCPLSVGNGQTAVMENPDFECVQNICQALQLATGEAQGTGGNGCQDGQRYRSGEECTLQCAANYVRAAGGTGVARCTGDNPDEVMVKDITCQPTCATFTCPEGYRAQNSAVTCTSSQCTQQQCCAEADCPQYASSKTVNGQRQLCTCDPGYTGTPEWGSGNWVHECKANCANTNFGGCTNGRTLVPNPGSVTCSGAGSCDAMSCPACQVAECCEDLVCQPPGDTRPQYVLSGGNDCTTRAECGTVSCARGYAGTPTITCPSAGGQFALEGCAVVDCPENASGDGTCECDPGFAIRSGGSPQFDMTMRTWQHECVPVCSNTGFTGCETQSLLRRADADTIFCSGTGNAASACTVAQCCVATCAQFQGGNGCQNANLKPRPNTTPQSLRCSGPAATDCSVSSCCVATCGNAGVTACDADGWDWKANFANIDCAGASVNDCNATTCCEPTKCKNFACAVSQSVDPVKAEQMCPNNRCTQNECCLDNTCNLIGQGSLLAYNIPARNTCTRVVDCGTVTCAQGYRLEGVPVPLLRCLVNGGDFEATGCIENECRSVGNLVGYIVENGPSCNRTSRCGGVECAPGYNDNNGMNVPQVVCPSQGGQMQGVGCAENVCQPPNTAEWRERFNDISVSQPTCTRVSDCGVVTCKTGWRGTPTLNCLTPGGEFTASGCEPNVCAAPISSPGYVTSDVTCTTVQACGTVKCAPGFVGNNPNVTCPVNGGSFQFNGCQRVGCPENADGPDCACKEGYQGQPVLNETTNQFVHECTAARCPEGASQPGQCTCDAGRVGTPIWNSASQTWDHECVLPTCNQPPGRTGLVGYIVENGATCTSLQTCGPVSCAPGFQAVPGQDPRLECGSNGFFVGRGCSSTSTPSPFATPFPGATPIPSGPCQDLRNDCAVQRERGQCTDPDVRGPCGCTCGGNLPPTFTQFVTTVRAVPGEPKQLTDYLTQVSPVEAGQTVQVQSCTPTDATIFTTAPQLQIVGTTPPMKATLTFVTSQTQGTSRVTCVLVDTGSPVQSAQVVFDVVNSRTGTPPVTPTTPPVNNNLLPCNGLCRFAPSVPLDQPSGRRRVTATVGQRFEGQLLTNFHGGQLGETVSATCSPNPPGAFTGAPTLTQSGNMGMLSFTAGPTPQLVQVTCTAIDLQQQRSQPFTFDVQLVSGGVTPPGPIVSDRVLRVGLMQALSAFTDGNMERVFREQMMALLDNGVVPGLRGIKVLFVCPVSACALTRTMCPVEVSQKLNSGCIRGSSHGLTSRAALTLQQQSSGVFVDFDLLTGASDGTAAKEAQRQQAITAINADITACGTTTCELQEVAPVGTADLVPKPVEDAAVDDDDDDDDMLPWWAWLLIALGALLLLACSIALFCMFGKKDKKKGKDEQGDYEQREMRGDSYDSTSYPTKEGEYGTTYTSRGSEDYYSSYNGDQSYGTEIVEFQQDEEVKAQYIDGEYYEGTIWSKAPDGTYNIRWEDGSHSEGVPPEQILRRS